MLKHGNTKSVPPKRVVIIGAKGFVGAATLKRLSEAHINCVAIGRDEIDFSEKNAATELAKILQPEDALIVIAAKAPCKNYDMLLQNIQMLKPICDVLSKNPVRHVIYISSDAVYADSMQKLTESSPAAPSSLHGVMHLAREKMLQSIVKESALAILRPSLLYGAKDPHNGYGPNSFYRLVQANKSIELFGQGEEQRDHVYIEDVAELIYLCLLQQSYGILNITTGDVVSFHQIAQQMKAFSSTDINIICRTRSGPMPHNGYRAFDNTACKHAFANFEYTSLSKGLEKMHQDYLKNSKGETHARN